MAYRNNADGWLVLIGLVVAVFIWRFIFDNPGTSLLIGALVLGVVGTWAHFHFESERLIAEASRKNDEALQRITRELAQRHAKTLHIKFQQLAHTDEYGVADFAAWYRHVEYFIENVVHPEAAKFGIQVDNVRVGHPLWLATSETIMDVILEHVSHFGEGLDISDVSTGIDYERFCQGELERCGWEVAATAVTGDQGADLIATRCGTRVIIQCKFYTKSVGNKAVQEAAAARIFHGGDHAVVVSNSSFTSSARALAQANDVRLLHHDQLEDLEALLGDNVPLRSSDHKTIDPVDLSAEATKLISDRPELWEFKLAFEVLKSELVPLQSRWEQLSRDTAPRKLKIVAFDESLGWAATRLKSLGRATSSIKPSLDRLTMGFGQPGLPGDENAIVRGCRSIGGAAAKLLEFEEEVHSARLFEDFQEIRALLQGAASHSLAEIFRLPVELSKVLESPSGRHEIKLVLSLPEGFEEKCDLALKRVAEKLGLAG